MQNQFNVEYPQNLPDLLQVTKQAFEDEARMAMAVKLFELGRLSSGQAAQLAALDRVQFILNLHRYGVSPVQVTPEELAEAGISEGLVRLSVGLEDPEDIIADLKQVLDTLV